MGKKIKKLKKKLRECRQVNKELFQERRAVEQDWNRVTDQRDELQRFIDTAQEWGVLEFSRDVNDDPTMTSALKREHDRLKNQLELKERIILKYERRLKTIQLVTYAQYDADFPEHMKTPLAAELLSEEELEEKKKSNKTPLADQYLVERKEEVRHAAMGAETHLIFAQPLSSTEVSVEEDDDAWPETRIPEEADSDGGA